MAFRLRIHNTQVPCLPPPLTTTIPTTRPPLLLEPYLVIVDSAKAMNDPWFGLRHTRRWEVT